MPSRDVPWVYDVKVKSNLIVEKLIEKGIQARYGFKPVSTCQPFRNQDKTSNSSLYSEKILYIPVIGTKKEIEFNIKELKKLL